MLILEYLFKKNVTKYYEKIGKMLRIMLQFTSKIKGKMLH